jgi:MATE family multidrug resistance protein
LTGEQPARGELAAHVRLAIPMVVQQLGFHLMGTVDTALLGHHSATALAAAGVGNNVLFAITAIGWGTVMGLDTVLPQALGAGQRDRARRSLAAGLRLAIYAGLACMVLAQGTPLVLSVLGVDRDVAREAKLYVDVRSLGIVPFLLSVALRSYFSAHHVTRPLVWAMVAGNIANAGLDLVLIYGLGPIPALGVAGAALATVAVQIAVVAFYFAGVRALDGGQPRPASTRTDVLEILRYGLPIGGHLCAEIGIFALASVLAGRLGRIPAASHAIALSLASFTFSVAVGIGISTSVRVGHAIGAGDRALARRRGVLGLWLGLGAMSLPGALFLIAPAALSALFTDHAPVIAAAIPLLQIAALFQLSDGAQAIAAGALRGIGDTRATFVGNLIGHYGVGLAVSLSLGFGAGLGTPGLWWGLSVGLTVTAIYLIRRFLVHTRASGVARA